MKTDSDCVGKKSLIYTSIELLGLPITIVNNFSGIVGGIWLALLGEWRLILIGILFFFTSKWILSILLLLNLPIGMALFYLHKKSRFFAYLFSYLSQLYINILVIGTCVLAFLLCSSFYTYKGNVDFGLIPYLLWSWGMALGTWQFFASKEPENEYTSITLFSASVFYLLFITSIFISSLLSLVIIIVLGVIQFIILPISNIHNALQRDSGGEI